MAHDFKHLKANVYLYDKLFKKETSDGSVVLEKNNTPVHGLNSFRNTSILIEIETILKSEPNWTVNQYNTYLHKQLPACTYLRHFKDYSFSQPDLPISKNLARDNYDKLWGIPRKLSETHKFVGGLEQFSASEKMYRKKLMDITMELTKKNPNSSIKDLEIIIERKYPIESELLLNYVKKYKRFMN